jgi:tetratricopeptide (TPR) repeat protein
MDRRSSGPAARHGATIILAATIGAITATSARAEPDGWTACAGEEPQYSLAQQIAGCTAYLATNPNDHNGLFNRGHSFEASGQYDQAISDYNRAIAAKPDYAIAYEARGNSYYKLRQFDWAITDYTRAIALMPDNAESYGNRGNAYLALGKVDKAIADYQKALKLDPTNQSAVAGVPLARAAKAATR